MATAIKRDPKTETKIVVVDEGGVTLEMSFEEAVALRTLLYHLAGNAPVFGIQRALGHAGVTTSSAYVLKNQNSLGNVDFSKKW